MKEVAHNYRNYWVAIVGAVFFLLAFGLGNYGFSFSGGEVGSETILISYIHLQLYVVPVLGLLLSFDGILQERESVMFDLYLSMSVKRSWLLIGKWIGLCVSLYMAILPGLLLQCATLVNAGLTPAECIPLSFYSLILCCIIVAIGVMVSTLSISRGTVIGAAFFIWLIFAVGMDFIIVALLVGTKGDVSSALINTLFLINPLSLFRLDSYSAYFPDEISELIQTGETSFSPVLLIIYQLLWIAAPLLIARLNIGRFYSRIKLEARS